MYLTGKKFDNLEGGKEVVPYRKVKLKNPDITIYIEVVGPTPKKLPHKRTLIAK